MVNNAKACRFDPLFFTSVIWVSSGFALLLGKIKQARKLGWTLTSIFKCAINLKKKQTIVIMSILTVMQVIFSGRRLHKKYKLEKYFLQKEPFYLCLLKKSHWVRVL